MGNIYTAVFAGVAATVAQDVFELVCGGDRLRLREIRLGQYTDFGDAAAEILGVTIVSGYTTTGSGGGAYVPANVSRHASGPLAAATVAINNTTVAADGTAKVLFADTWNLAAGWWYSPPQEEQIIITNGQRLVVRITVPADSITMNGTLVFEEIPGTVIGGVGA